MEGNGFFHGMAELCSRGIIYFFGGIRAGPVMLPLFPLEISSRGNVGIDPGRDPSYTFLRDIIPKDNF